MTTILERISEKTEPGVTPMYSPYGYIVQPDGTLYTLVKQYCHGAVMACLYPEALAAWRDNRQVDSEYNAIPGTGEVVTLPSTVDDLNVLQFQRFELDQHGALPVLRVCPERQMGVSIDRPKTRCTPEQVAAMRLVIMVLGMKPDGKIITDYREMRVKEMWQFLETEMDVMDDLAVVAPIEGALEDDD